MALSPRALLLCDGLAALCLGLSIWGIVNMFIFCFIDGWYGNNFAGVWTCWFAGVMMVQAVLVMHRPLLTNKNKARWWTWVIYSCFMMCVAVSIIVGYAAGVPQPDSLPGPQGWWGLLWFPPLLMILLATTLWNAGGAASTTTGSGSGGSCVWPGTTSASPSHRYGEEPVPPVAAEGDPEAPLKPAQQAQSMYVSSAPPLPEQQQQLLQQEPGCACCARGRPAAPRRRCCAGGCSCRSCMRGFTACLGWSSIFWLAFLGFFLMLQALWLLADHEAFPPPGQLVSVDWDFKGTTYQPKIHVFCTGPKANNSALSTFVLEAGGGSPSASLFGIQRALEKLGRRSCSYDRLGGGWSDDAIKPSSLSKVQSVLQQALRGAGEAGPFIMVGHSVGGQLALYYTFMHPADVRGVALLDSYSEQSISLDAKYLQVKVDPATNASTIVKDNLYYPDSGVNPIINLVRFTTPLAFARFISPGPQGAVNRDEIGAMYGNNKEWQVQWVEFNARLTRTIDSELTAMAGGAFWFGTGWPSLGSKPVLLLPASGSLSLPCNFSAASCQAIVSSDLTKWFGAKLYMEYNKTLSSNTSLTVVTGAHDFPVVQPSKVANLLAEKFAGV